MNYSAICSLILSVLIAYAPPGMAQPGLVGLLENHFTRTIEAGRDLYGALQSPVWMSSIDPRTGGYPDQDQRPENIPSRVYLNRSVDAPRGASLYWDLPAIAAVFELSKHRAKVEYREAAAAYLKYYLDRCRAQNGIILWGNHYFYNAFQDQCVKFNASESPRPVDMKSESGDLHETRPFAPPWEILWALDADLVRTHIPASAEGHMVDEATGEFNRHADHARGYAFIEYGGILAHSLAWLYGKTGDISLLERADKVIGYSYEHRSRQTGLLENCPTQDRWDKYTATTEIGLWAGYVLKAGALANDHYREKWLKIVDESVSSWLAAGWDKRGKKYYGGLNIANGSPFEPAGDYPYQPGKYADIWNPLFPTHDYPLQLAETCLELFKLTGKKQHRTACKRWLQHLRRQLEDAGTEGLRYAENYARILHFLMAYQEAFRDGQSKKLAHRLLDEAVAKLYLPAHRMFRSHTGEYRYDAVDGVGLLALVFLWWDTGERPEVSTYFF